MQWSIGGWSGKEGWPYEFHTPHPSDKEMPWSGILVDWFDPGYTRDFTEDNIQFDKYPNPTRVWVNAVTWEGKVVEYDLYKEMVIGGGCDPTYDNYEECIASGGGVDPNALNQPEYMNGAVLVQSPHNFNLTAITKTELNEVWERYKRNLFTEEPTL